MSTSAAGRKTRESSPHEGFWAKGRQAWDSAYNGVYRRFMIMGIRDVPLVIFLSAIILTGFGCMMVLSASFAESISQGSPAYGQAMSQLRSALVGTVIFGVAAFTPVRVYRNPLVPHLLLMLALVLQLAVVLVGVDVNGNRNWIRLGGQSLQPSEISKILIIIWLAYVLNMRGNISRSISKALLPSLVGWGALVGMILLGRDLGTVLVYAAIYLGMLWFAGAPHKLLLGVISAGAVIVTGLIIQSPNRLDRLFAVVGNCNGAVCDQANAGLAALATGGIWGVGLGQSRQKYNYLPEAHNDYIFAIIGEELGLVGTFMTLVLYLGLIYGAVRIMLRSTDRFIRLATGGILIWFAVQMLINIAMVTGLGPVVGIPLPFVSFGGTSLMASFAAVGCLVAFARQTPVTPLAGENPQRKLSTISDPRERKDAQRRRKLLPVIAAEQEQIRTSKPIDWYKVLSQLGLGPAAKSTPTEPPTIRTSYHGEVPARRRSSTRPSNSVQRQAAARTQHSEVFEHTTNNRKPTKRHVPAQISQAVAQKSARAQGTTHRGMHKTGTVPASRQVRKPERAQETKLPAGLKPIRKAHKMPEER